MVYIGESMHIAHGQNMFYMFLDKEVERHCEEILKV